MSGISQHSMNTGGTSALKKFTTVKTGTDSTTHDPGGSSGSGNFYQGQFEEEEEEYYEEEPEEVTTEIKQHPFDRRLIKQINPDVLKN